MQKVSLIVILNSSFVCENYKVNYKTKGSLFSCCMKGKQEQMHLLCTFDISVPKFLGAICEEFFGCA
jgi:hypothetical protein